MASGAFDALGELAPIRAYDRTSLERFAHSARAAREDVERDLVEALERAAVAEARLPGDAGLESIPSDAVDAWFSSVGHATLGEARRRSPGPTRLPTATAPSRFPFDVILALLPMVAISIGVVVLLTRIA